MPIKFRCPHCFKTLIAEDDTVGQPKPCPACGRIMHVPASLDAGVGRRVARAACPRCQAETAPTATFCHSCFTVFATGKRLPWRQRLPYVSWQYWAVRAGGGAVVVFVLFAAIQYARIHLQKPTTQPAILMQPQAVDAAPLARRLLGAASSDERRAALDALAGIEVRAVPAVATALEQSLTADPTSQESTRNQVAAIELLLRYRDSDARHRAACVETFKRCESRAALRAAALRARALFDDAGVTRAAVEQWLAMLERANFLERLASQMVPDGNGARMLATQSRQEADRLADGLRHLGRGESRTVFEVVAERLWDTWDWLGQREGLTAAREMFDLARPADASLRFDPNDVRRPRDVMRELAENAQPGVRAAAALALVNVPQYRTLAERLVQTLAKVTRDADPVDQQRLVWVISYLRGKRFTTRALKHPLDVTSAEVAAAQAWAGDTATPVVKAPYAEPPRLTYRAVTPRRQLAAVLGARLTGDWEGSVAAMDAWLVARLGVTPRIAELIDPTQRAPNEPGLAAALVIAGASGGAAERKSLELWRDAREQPPWVRALAMTGLARIDLASGSTSVAWPRGLDVGPIGTLDGRAPGWRHFGQIIAAGGPAMRDLLNRDGGGGLTREVRAKLLDAAARAMERDAAGPR